MLRCVKSNLKPLTRSRFYAIDCVIGANVPLTDSPSVIALKDAIQRSTRNPTQSSFKMIDGMIKNEDSSSLAMGNELTQFVVEFYARHETTQLNQYKSAQLMEQAFLKLENLNETIFLKVLTKHIQSVEAGFETHNPIAVKYLKQGHQNGIKFSAESTRLVLASCVSQRSGSDAASCLAIMKEQNLEVTAADYAQVIDAYGMTKDAYNAHIWFKEYQNSGMESSNLIFEAFAQSLVRTEQVVAALDVYFKLMPASGSKVSIHQFNKLLVALVQTAQLEDAEEIIEMIFESGGKGMIEQFKDGLGDECIANEETNALSVIVYSLLGKYDRASSFISATYNYKDIAGCELPFGFYARLSLLRGHTEEAEKIFFDSCSNDFALLERLLTTDKNSKNDAQLRSVEEIVKLLGYCIDSNFTKPLSPPENLFKSDLFDGILELLIAQQEFATALQCATKMRKCLSNSSVWCTALWESFKSCSNTPLMTQECFTTLSFAWRFHESLSSNHADEIFDLYALLGTQGLQQDSAFLSNVSCGLAEKKQLEKGKLWKAIIENKEISRKNLTKSFSVLLENLKLSLSNGDTNAIIFNFRQFMKTGAFVPQNMFGEIIRSLTRQKDVEKIAEVQLAAFNNAKAITSIEVLDRLKGAYYSHLFIAYSNLQEDVLLGGLTLAYMNDLNLVPIRIDMVLNTLVKGELVDKLISKKKEIRSEMKTELSSRSAFQHKISQAIENGETDVVMQNFDNLFKEFSFLPIPAYNSVILFLANQKEPVLLTRVFEQTIERIEEKTSADYVLKVKENYFAKTLNIATGRQYNDLVVNIVMRYMNDFEKVPLIFDLIVSKFARSDDNLTFQKLIAKRVEIEPLYKFSRSGERVNGEEQDSALTRYRNRKQNRESLSNEPFPLLFRQLARLGNKRELLDCFDDYLETSTSVNTFNQIILIFFKLKDFASCINIYRVMKQTNTHLNRETLSLILSVHARFDHDVESATSILEELKRLKCVTYQHYQIMISIHTFHKDVSQVEMMLSQASELGIASASMHAILKELTRNCKEIVPKTISVELTPDNLISEIEKSNSLIKSHLELDIVEGLDYFGRRLDGMTDKSSYEIVVRALVLCKDMEAAQSFINIGRIKIPEVESLTSLIQ